MAKFPELHGELIPDEHIEAKALWDKPTVFVTEDEVEKLKRLVKHPPLRLQDYPKLSVVDPPKRGERKYDAPTRSAGVKRDWTFLQGVCVGIALCVFLFLLRG